jgi:tetrahydromethanopterin S-methyltransferase subunit F
MSIRKIGQIAGVIFSLVVLGYLCVLIVELVIKIIHQ